MKLPGNQPTKHLNEIRKLSRDLHLPEDIALITAIKAKLSRNLIKEMKSKGLTHDQVARLSGIPRGVITKIANGDQQKITIDKLIILNHAVGVVVSVSFKRNS